MDHPLSKLPDGQFPNQQPGYPPPQPYFQQPGYAPPPAGQPGYGAPGYGAPGYGVPGYAAPGFGAPNGYQPIMNQPNAEQWMAFPHAPPPGCPPGLEYLMQIDQLLVKQQVELLEAITGFETCNKYKVKNSMGQNVYFAAEDTDCCTRQCCGPARPFDIKIFDNNNQEVIHLSRPLRCGACCFPCCLQELEVTSPPGTIIGYVIQKWAFCGSLFQVCDALKNPVLLIEGPICTVNLCGDVEFKVLTMDGTNQVGRISKQWSGLLKEALTDADTFGITFPMDLDVKVKAVMLGACFLIDFMFFETSDNNNNHH